MPTIIAPNAPDGPHLVKVAQQMKRRGPPVLRAFKVRGVYWAIEGSHRLAAAYILNLRPVFKIVPHDDLMTEANALAQRLLKPAPLAMRATKEVAARGQDMPFVQAIRFGETMRRVGGATEDAQEGRAAFREKRPPQWKGR